MANTQTKTQAKTYLDKGISAMQPMINATHSTSTDTDKVGVVLCEDKCLGYINLRLGTDL